MAFDYICAKLVCRACGVTPTDPCALDLQTKIASHPELRNIHVGERVEVVADPRAAGYLQLSDSADMNHVVVIEAWSCPSCGAHQWARLTLDSGVLVAVENTDVTEESLSTADFITWEVTIYVPLDDVPKLESLGTADLRSELARYLANRTN